MSSFSMLKENADGLADYALTLENSMLQQQNAELSGSLRAVIIVAVLIGVVLVLSGMFFLRRLMSRSNDRQDKLMEQLEGLRAATAELARADMAGSVAGEKSVVHKDFSKNTLSTSDMNALQPSDMENSEFLKRIHKLLDKDITLSANVERLSSAMNMTTQTFRRHLKALTGLSPKDYLSKVQMEMACEMLTSTDEPVSNIGERCGFSDTSNFTRAFKRQYGMSPSKYRKVNLKN